MRFLLPLLLALVLGACSTFRAQTIESSLQAVRSACAALGAYDLDECAARLEAAASEQDAGK